MAHENDNFYAGMVLSFSEYAKWFFPNHNETCIIGRLKEQILHCTYHDIFHYTPFASWLLTILVLQPIFHFLIFHDFMHAYFSESHTSIYPFQFAFWIKLIPFPWSHYLDFLAMLIHTACPWVLSIYSPTKSFYTNSRWLMWDSLRPTFQQVLPHRHQHLIWEID